MEMLWTWLLSFFFILTLLCILGYQLVCLVDLEFDYINPYDSSSRINNTVLPEFIVQGVLCAILLITTHWFMLLLALPHLYYNVNSYMKGRHLVDVTEIYNRKNNDSLRLLICWSCSSSLYSGCFGALETNPINHAMFLPLSSTIEPQRRLSCGYESVPVQTRPDFDT